MEPKFKEHFKKFRIIFNFQREMLILLSLKKIFRENLNVHFYLFYLNFVPCFPIFFMDICTLWYVISSTPMYVLQNRHNNCFQFDVEQWDIFFIAEHRKYFWIYSSVGSSVH